MKRGTKLALLAGFAGIVAVACAVGTDFVQPYASPSVSKIEKAVSDYRGGVPGPKETDATADAIRFATAYRWVRNSYVRPTTEPELFKAAIQGMKKAYPDPSVATDSDLYEAAMQGMLTSLDDYSIYMDTKAYDQLNEDISGQFGGLGIEIKKDPTGLEVISPIDGTPAMLAGIQTGDRLTHADGISLADLTLRESVVLLRGAPGTTVTVKINRSGRPPFDVPLTREIIHVADVKAHMEGDIGYLRITQFVTDTGEDLRRAMHMLQGKAGPNGVKGYVLDLRSNPGGLLNESIAVAGSFLSGGVVVSTRSRTDSDEFNADLPDPSHALPMVVLINKGSASASEIVSGAIKDRHRGLIIGEKSYGKGSVQSTFPFHGGGGLKMTTALYYTPSGGTVNGGIHPNIEALDDPDTPQIDEALQVALKVVQSEIDGHPVPWSGGTVKN